MRAPGKADLEALRRLSRYLLDSPRVVYVFPWGSIGDQLVVYADTDFAGCRSTRRSTSGGCALWGGRLVKHWSSTQKAVTLSSGEAELGGVVKAASEALGLQSVAQDLGLELCISLCTDSSAAVGICRRSGIGRVRHLAVGQLWVQELVRDGAVALYKVKGELNPADLFTKPLGRAILDAHLGRLRACREAGRAASAPAASAEVDTSLASADLRSSSCTSRCLRGAPTAVGGPRRRRGTGYSARRPVGWWGAGLWISIPVLIAVDFEHLKRIFVEWVHIAA
jgi:hypothetical protein